MALVLPAAVADINRRSTRFAARCFAVETRSIGSYYWTTHDRPFRIGLDQDGPLYLPGGAITTQAIRKRNLLGGSNTRLNGVIAGTVTYKSLRFRQWDDARVTEYSVDWRSPEFGPMRTSEYFVANVEFDEITWAFELSGLSERLRVTAGGSMGGTWARGDARTISATNSAESTSIRSRTEWLPQSGRRS